MTSQVNPNNIDGTYPVAGQDNDSQGFRDNFTNIRNNFTFTKAEIEDLQNKAVLKSALLNTVLSNDFAGNAIVNPAFTSWRETYNNIGSVSGSVTINFINGNFQKITMSGATILNFSFPVNTSNQYASIKLWVSNPSAAYTLTFPNSLTLGDPDTVAGFSGNTITFSSADISNSTDYYFEIFTVDGGTTLGIQDLTRNRDFDGNSISISGNLSLTNITASGNIVTTNGVFWAGNGLPFSSASGGSGAFSTVTASSTIIGSGNIVAAATTAATSSTTGALVVTGGVGIASNVHIDGNLWVNSGNIRSTSTRANIFNITATTISLGNAASFISMGSAGSNVLLNGGLTVVGNTITAGGQINTNYFLANVVTDQNLFANVNYNRFIANCSPTGTVANLFITLPNSVEDGRIIDITSMTAITSCFVSNMTAGVTSVYGLANNWAASASLTSSISIKLLYNASIGRWFKV